MEQYQHHHNLQEQTDLYVTRISAYTTAHSLPDVTVEVIDTHSYKPLHYNIVIPLETYVTLFLPLQNC